MPRTEDAFDCVGDRHNEELAAHFPAGEVHGAGRSWVEFTDSLTRPELIGRLAAQAH